MRIVCTNVNAATASQFLKTNEDIGLDVFDQMPQMDVAVGVRQCRSHEHAFGGHEAPVIY
jgi:hypothetical protein